MYSQTNEQALEIAIEQALTGHSNPTATADRISDVAPLYTGSQHYLSGNPADFDPNFAIDRTYFWHFLESTQAEELKKLKHNPQWQRQILERLDRLVKKHGILHILRKGLAINNASLQFYYPLPKPSSSRRVHEQFRQNIFSVTRQVHYNLDKPGESIDMVLFLNGLPIATMELKNAWTGQTARVNAINQYKFDRDPRQPLLQFGRAIVHFGVDTDEVYMTTKLEGKKTFFLPFNKGYNNGKGNPPNPNGHKTAYLWEDILTPRSLSNILQHFVRFDGKTNEPLSKKRLFFPRYHQLDVVRQIIKETSHNGVGKRYLIQHSAGSGKSNSITWAAYQLIETYPASAGLPGVKSMEQPLFDTVIVVTDRRLLDKQIRENIKAFSQVKNIVAPAYSSKELKDNLEQGKKIVITTIQKFPFIVEGISDMSDRRFAVIIDEAHSSQGGVAAGMMNQALGQQADEEIVDIQDKILQVMRSRKMKGNASYFAFTATPKAATLERFGIPQPEGGFAPFHLYSMKQAIEEGFILDVLANYTTYRSYYKIQKSIEDNPLFDTAKAQKRLRAFVERDPRTIATKAQIMLDHFMTKIYQPKKLKGKAKAMVATQNIETAIRYYQALKKLLNEMGNPFKIAIAFSGKKTVNGIEYTEAGLNGFPDTQTREKFDEDDYRILVVANKYLTGFDQPKLTAMYVDKKLEGVMAVQALSRLNRIAPELGKRTEDLFVLDFFNNAEDIQKSFEPFYTATMLTEPTDVNVLHDIKDALDSTGVYEWQEVEHFVEKFFTGADAQELSPIIDRAAARFNSELDWEHEEKADFKIKAKQFVKLYGQVAAILPYEILDWEKLFWYLKFLIPKLIVKDAQEERIDEILNTVDLSTYALQRTGLNAHLYLTDTDGNLTPTNTNPRGVHGNVVKDPLDAIIEQFNERWFSGWEATPEDQRIVLLQLIQKIKEHPDYQSKFADNKDRQNRDLTFKKILDDVMLKKRRQDADLYKLYSKDEGFYRAFFDTMKRLAEMDLPDAI